MNVRRLQQTGNVKSVNEWVDKVRNLDCLSDKSIIGYKTLSDRNKEMMELIKQGMTKEQIADSLGITANTVIVNCRHILSLIELYDSLPDNHIRLLGLNNKICNALERRRITDINTLVNVVNRKGAYALSYNIRNIGPVALEEIKAVLREKGYEIDEK